MADQIASGSLSVAWDGVTPAAAPANSTVVLPLGKSGAAGCEITGTFTGTIVLEASFDGVTWFAPACTTVANASATNSLTAPGRRKIDPGAAVALRARMSAFTSGAAVTTLTGTPVGMGIGTMSGGEVTMADGADRAEGTTTDAAVQGDNAGTLSAKLRGLNKSVAAGYDTGGFSAAPLITLTRPANTTAYTAQDEVATTGTAPVSIAVSRVTGQTGIITGARLIYSSNPAAAPGFRLLLFSATVTAAGDNSPLNLSDGDAALYLGLIDFSDTQAGGSATNANLMASGAPKAPITVTTDTVFGLLIATNGFTPIAASETVKIAILTEQN